MRATGLTICSGTAMAAALSAMLALPDAATAQPSLEQRKALYAPWSPDQMAQRRKEYGLIGPGTTRPVPPPAFPSYLKKPDSIEQLMPQARAAVRQTGGRTPLGLVDPGKHLLIVVGEVRDSKPNMMVQEAIKRAYGGARRQVHDPHDLGHARHERGASISNSATAFAPIAIGDGQRELESLLHHHGLHAECAEGPRLGRQQGSRACARDLAEPRNSRTSASPSSPTSISRPPRTRSSPGSTSIRRSTGSSGAAATGRTRARCCAQHGEKFLGNYTYLDLYDLMSQVPSFPSDVWRLVETKTMEPLAFVDRAEVTDPEGTAFGYDVDEEMAKNWAAGVYNQGHLYMYPAQATGRFPYSIIEYPTMGGSYLPPVQPETTGIIASTSSHAATHPRMEIFIEKGRVKEVKGGGLYGEGIRLMMTYPGIERSRCGRSRRSPATGGSTRPASAPIRNTSSIRPKCSKATISRSATSPA